jgi:hypothetical protein
VAAAGHRPPLRNAWHPHTKHSLRDLATAHCHLWLGQQSDAASCHLCFVHWHFTALQHPCVLSESPATCNVGTSSCCRGCNGQHGVTATAGRCRRVVALQHSANKRARGVYACLRRRGEDVQHALRAENKWLAHASCTAPVGPYSVIAWWWTSEDSCVGCTRLMPSYSLQHHYEHRSGTRTSQNGGCAPPPSPTQAPHSQATRPPQPGMRAPRYCPMRGSGASAGWRTPWPKGALPAIVPPGLSLGAASLTSA